MNIPDIIVLDGSYVVMAPLELHHIDALYTAGAYDDIWRFMPVKVNTIDDMRRLVVDAIRNKQAGSEYPFIVLDKSTGNIIGSTRFLEISPVHKALEIGWTWYTPNAQGTSINPECKLLLLEYAFETLGCIRVQLKTDLRNERSQRAIEKLGAKREGVLRKHRILWDGYIRDSVYYSILDSEWPDIKKRLLKRLTI